MSNSLKLTRLAMTAVLAVGISAVALANTTTSSIRGNVATESGTIFPNASVTIVHTPSGTITRTSTNSSGAFSARSLRVGGPYSIEISGPDFEDVKLDGVNLSLDQEFNLPVTVQAVGVMAEVVVTAKRLGQTGFRVCASPSGWGCRASQNQPASQTLNSANSSLANQPDG